MKKLIPIFSVTILLSILAGCGSARKNMATTAEEQFRLAKQEYDKGKYYNSIESFQRLVFNFPGATVVDTAQYYLAHSYYGNKEYELAAVEFDRLISNYPQSRFIDDAEYMVGLCYMKNSPKNYSLDQEDLKRAITRMEDFILDNPDSPLVEDAKNAIKDARSKLAHKDYDNGITYFKMYSYKAARVYFQKVIDEYTDTKYASMALFKMAEAYYKEKNYVESKTKFDGFLNLYPDNEMAPMAREYLEKISVKTSTDNAAG